VGLTAALLVIGITFAAMPVHAQLAAVAADQNRRRRTGGAASAILPPASSRKRPQRKTGTPAIV